MPEQLRQTTDGEAVGCTWLATEDDLTLEQCFQALCTRGGDSINYRPVDFSGDKAGQCNLKTCGRNVISSLTSSPGGWDVYTTIGRFIFISK